MIDIIQTNVVAIETKRFLIIRAVFALNIFLR